MLRQTDTVECVGYIVCCVKKYVKIPRQRSLFKFTSFSCPFHRRSKVNPRDRDEINIRHLNWFTFFPYRDLWLVTWTSLSIPPVQFGFSLANSTKVCLLIFVVNHGPATLCLRPCIFQSVLLSWGDSLSLSLPPSLCFVLDIWGGCEVFHLLLRECHTPLNYKAETSARDKAQQSKRDASKLNGMSVYSKAESFKGHGRKLFQCTW